MLRPEAVADSCSEGGEVRGGGRLGLTGRGQEGRLEQASSHQLCSASNGDGVDAHLASQARKG